jgi:hypothetical protein
MQGSSRATGWLPPVGGYGVDLIADQVAEIEPGSPFASPAAES